MRIMLDISEQEIKRLHELVEIPSSIESVDEAEVALAIHTLIEVA